MTRSIPGAVALLAAALALPGCSKSPPAIVSAGGVVLLNGQPLPNAQVQFVPMIQGYGAEYIAVGITDEKGRFTLTCNGQPGACACENRVTVADAPPPAKTRGLSDEAQAEMTRFYAGLKNRPIPPDYGSVAKTPLVIKVTPGQADYTLELKR
jgi:hypothetical protein